MLHHYMLLQALTKMDIYCVMIKIIKGIFKKIRIEVQGI